MLATLFLSVVLNQELKPAQIIPRPQTVWDVPGNEFVFLQGTKILTSDRPSSLHHLTDLIKRCTGEKPKVFSQLLNRQSDPVVMLMRSEQLPPEGYRLHAEQTDLVINYADDAGLFYAVQSLRQLLPPDIEIPASARKKWSVPAIRIEDAPRFPWRGMHLDVSRHFFDVDFIKRYIDFIAMHKMNVFHWHLIDDGGWRMEVKGYPLLTEVGAWRAGKADEWSYSDIRMLFDPSEKPRYGGYYTQEEIREVVEYARDRYVTVVPEIELPGHTTPSIVAYPFLGCDDVAPAKEKGRTTTNVYCAGKETTFDFLEDVLGETMELFPSEYIHIGGDEVYKGHWANCSKCKKRMRDEGLNSVDELQSYFIKRIEKFLVSKGRKLVGWDEILEGGLAPEATVMSWRGEAGGIAAAKAGHDVVMSPTSHSYFDYSYESISTEQVYNWNPVPSELTEREAERVLGGQANVWTEWIPTEERTEYMIFPRMLATAESLWTRKKNTTWKDFSSRLVRYFDRLDALSVSYHIPAPSVDFTAVVFQEEATVTVEMLRGSPFSLRYTMDGSAPDGRSKRYTKPITISVDTTIRFANVNKDGQVGDVVSVECVKRQSGNSNGMVQGLDFAVYEGEWESVPDFNRMTPAKTGHATEIKLDQRTRDDNFAVHFKGYIQVQNEGVHRFRLGSDDGSWLKIAGATVVNHDGLHGHTEKEGAVRLARGVYPIELGFFEAGGAHSLTLQVQLPGEEWKPAPSGLFLRRD